MCYLMVWPLLYFMLMKSYSTDVQMNAVLGTILTELMIMNDRAYFNWCHQLTLTFALQ